ncbi:MAG: 2-amino-4-hydroxy-6-hydroxymethyldihydropteridine diphosphokinase [Lachnospiraceae bacterium]|nr:2-amino-4-hydroxy-6-hydroxymethyldihydropteridine diphosphokinase [Lachnospiraceae bacterium]
MDKIRIHNLKVFAHHGVYEAENQLGQMFLVNVEASCHTRKAGCRDALEDSVSYGVMAREIHAYMQSHTCQLLEAVAEQLAEMLLLAHPMLESITLEIRKPWAPVGLPLDYVSVEITRGWHTAYIALGSNLGDKEGYLQAGIHHLKQCSQIMVEQVSSFFVTEPYGGVEQDDFLNGCIKVRTLLSPFELLEKMQEAEYASGRERLIHWGPRTLDLDLLFYDQEIISSPTLVVPHPEIPKRTFVLEPLAELAPWLRHPQTGLTVQEMLQKLQTGHLS